jgi:hypothetical protein
MDTVVAKVWQFDDISIEAHCKAPPQTGPKGDDSDAQSGEVQSQDEKPASERFAPVAKQLGELVRLGKDDPSELLKHRFLCRGAGMLVAGPTGVGKSTKALQCAGAWAVGRPGLESFQRGRSPRS